MTNQNNPASRLHSILTKSKLGQFRQHSAMKMWAEVFEIDLEEPSGDTLLIVQLANLRGLVDDVKSKVLAEEVKNSLYLKHFDKIEAATRFDQLGAAWSGSENQLTEAAMDGLEHCAELLSKSYAESDISEEILAIKDNVDELSEEVLASDLDPEIRDFILKELEMIRRGIFDYRTRGAAGLKDSIAMAVGTIVMVQGVPKPGNDNGFYAKTKKIILEIDGLVSTAQRMTAVAAPVVRQALEHFG